MSSWFRQKPKPPTPPRVRTVTAKVWINGTTTGIPNATIEVTNEHYVFTAGTNRDGIVWFLNVPESVHYFNISVRAEGYSSALVPPRVYIPSGQHDIPPVFLLPIDVRPPILKRDPLPPFDRDATDPETGAHLPVLTTINGTIPPYEDDEYLRANLWGMTLPGLPAIPGGASGAAQERMLTYLFDRYPTEWQAKGLKDYYQRGLRHWWLSWPDARSHGQTIEQYRDDTKRVQDAYLEPCHFLRSKDHDGHNPDPSQVDALVDALVAIYGIPWAAHAWEASLWNSPEHYRKMIDHDARRHPQIRWCVHLQQGYAHFGPDYRPEDGGGLRSAKEFWNANITVGVKRLLYQYDLNWTAGMMLAKGNDVSVRLIQGGTWSLPTTVDWFAFEILAQHQFNNGRDADGRLADEDMGDLKGYETLCTPGPLPPRGFGNGARYPDGRAI